MKTKTIQIAFKFFKKSLRGTLDNKSTKNTANAENPKAYALADTKMKTIKQTLAEGLLSDAMPKLEVLR